jgi:hypothetical protein
MRRLVRVKVFPIELRQRPQFTPFEDLGMVSPMQKRLVVDSKPDVNDTGDSVKPESYGLPETARQIPHDATGTRNHGNFLPAAILEALCRPALFRHWGLNE